MSWKGLALTWLFFAHVRHFIFLEILYLVYQMANHYYWIKYAYVWCFLFCVPFHPFWSSCGSLGSLCDQTFYCKPIKRSGVPPKRVWGVSKASNHQSVFGWSNTSYHTNPNLLSQYNTIPSPIYFLNIIKHYTHFDGWRLLKYILKKVKKNTSEMFFFLVEDSLFSLLLGPTKCWSL